MTLEKAEYLRKSPIAFYVEAAVLDNDDKMHHETQLSQLRDLVEVISKPCDLRHSGKPKAHPESDLSAKASAKADPG